MSYSFINIKLHLKNACYIKTVMKIQLKVEKKNQIKLKVLAINLVNFFYSLVNLTGEYKNI